MNFFEIKKRRLKNGKYISVSESGNFLISDAENFDSGDKKKLLNAGFCFNEVEDFFFLSNKFRRYVRTTPPQKLNYIIAIPTLRCDLSCSYCQVSRANTEAKGYDWSEELVGKFIAFVSDHCEDNVKIEFQGGEPSLRLDIVKRVVDEVSITKPKSSFVLCTNLSKIESEMNELLSNEKFHISSSLDGPPEIHTRNRTQDSTLTNQFFRNLDFILNQYGSNKISLLPTITDYDQIPEIIDFFFEKGISEIFLRPVNYQGFAKKKYSIEANAKEAWVKAYLNALEYIEEKNSKSARKIIETGLSIHLNRIIKPKSFDYVDLRNPNLLGADYLVINYDGKLFPTDESRMLHRVGIIDMSIGDILTGIDKERVQAINSRSANFGDPACDNCAYQIYCGVDNVDKISRYGTLDHPTLDTFFCHNHMNIFDYIFQKISTRKPETLLNYNLHLSGKYEVSTIFSEVFYD